jgi:hypothetical protein
MEPTRVLVRLSDRKIKQLLPAALPAKGDSVPDPLIRATVGAAVRAVRGEIAPVEIMSPRATGLVRDALKALAYKRWNILPS